MNDQPECTCGARFFAVIPGPAAAWNPESVRKASETDSGFDPSGRPGMTSESFVCFSDG